MNEKTILVVDDEENILELLTYNLENADYTVIIAKTGEEALELIEKSKINLILLDIMLPGIDGIEVLRNIRRHEKYQKLPVVIFTSISDEISKVVGFEVGADDYLTKPIGVHELLARLKAVLRRTEGSLSLSESVALDNEEQIVIDNIAIDKSRRVLLVDNQEVELTLKEFDLLYFLADNRKVVFSRDDILGKIWGPEYLGKMRTVDVHIRNLRRKIEVDDNNPFYIKTIRGVGYKFG